MVPLEKNHINDLPPNKTVQCSSVKCCERELWSKVRETILSQALCPSPSSFLQGGLEAIFEHLYRDVPLLGFPHFLELFGFKEKPGPGLETGLQMLLHISRMWASARRYRNDEYASTQHSVYHAKAAQGT